MYHLIQHADHESHELEMIFRAQGLALYAFTFNRCVAHGAAADDPGVFTVH
jgi:hypothetical protein